MNRCFMTLNATRASNSIMAINSTCTPVSPRRSLNVLVLCDPVAQPITSFLPNSDVKNLRLTSAGFRSTVLLHIKRVFSSANILNIKVLQEIANSNKYRKGVAELLWDDTCFGSVESMSRPGYYYNSMNSIGRFLYSRRPNCRDHDVPMRQLAAAMTSEDSYAYYYSLADQQHQIHVSRADIDAFLYALERFPSLSRVTTTSRAHGRLFMPRIEIP
ncbi:putative transcriptional regulatory protein [Fusarium oxysporum f. sp. albedinis]|nr:putative transcriptional regulatory protein [Fusarium oxysporum f. sp. albedinis]